MMLGILCAVLCAYSVIALHMIIPSRMSAAHSLIVTGGGMGLFVALYLLLLRFGIGKGIGALVIVLLPMLCMAYLISCDRGCRFAFAFCSVIHSAILILQSTSIFARFFKLNFVSSVCTMLAFCTAGLYAIYQIHTRLKAKIKAPKKGWGYLAALSGIMLLLLAVFTFYPLPISERREYYPVMLTFLAADISVYVLMLAFILSQSKCERLAHQGELMHAQLALKNSQLEVQKLYYKLANTDAMTGLANRASYEQNSQAAKANWSQLMPAVCYLCDLNNLKRVNDKLGHAEGDALICDVAAILREVFSDTPEVYRMGGDEFLIMGYRISREDAEIRLSQIRSRISEHNAHRDKADDRINLAVGMACTDTSELEFEALVKQADENMYENKRESK